MASGGQLAVVYQILQNGQLCAVIQVDACCLLSGGSRVYILGASGVAVIAAGGHGPILP